MHIVSVHVGDLVVAGRACVLECEFKEVTLLVRLLIVDEDEQLMMLMLFLLLEDLLLSSEGLLPMSLDILLTEIDDIIGESDFDEEFVEFVLLVESESLLLSLAAGVGVSGAIKPSLTLFFCFMRRFWNQILT